MTVCGNENEQLLWSALEADRLWASEYRELKTKQD